MLRFFKELGIYILIIALIVLVFGIIFYEKLPSNKLVPVKDNYALPENLENVLEDTLAEEEQKEVLVTYTVEESDLKDKKQYDPGKIDPFADDSEGVTGDTDGTSLNTNKGNTSSTNGLGGGHLTETKPGK